MLKMAPILICLDAENSTERTAEARNVLRVCLMKATFISIERCTFTLSLYKLLNEGKAYGYVPDE